ncbi:hypothetical protein BJ508DRAFT_213247, partial [Ascobolus immersus RN42]
MATGKHPAMIYADQAIDGPVIGTLVVILDKGRNLPSRKSYGKQDPYCVCRLGKEGKRTEADKRGGQTPIWDKELRFTVRDSPDYKTLKITCFNEDKKTDLIGEVSIPLDKILVKGGGTEDGWRVLTFRSKYAGEIYVELSFWDTRPKDDPKPSRRREEAAPVREKTTKGLSGPRSAPSAGKPEARNPEDVLPPSSFAPEPEKKEKPSASGYPPSPYRGNGRSPSPMPPRNGRSPSPMPPRNGRSPSPMPPRNGRTPSPMPMRNGRSPSPMPPRMHRTPSPQPPRPGEIRALPAPEQHD